MSWLSIFWTLFSAACILQSNASAETGVSLNCTKECAAKGVTLNCTVHYRYIKQQDCKVVRYWWSDTHGQPICNNSFKKYPCDWNSTWVSLTVSDVTGNQNYTIVVGTNYGRAEDTITVNLSCPGGLETVQGTSDTSQVPVLCGVVITLIVGISCFLLFAVVKYAKKKTTEEGYSETFKPLKSVGA